MSQLEVPEEIEHLDFEPEKEEKKTHWGDPIRQDLRWCGEKKPKATPFMNQGSISASKVTCVRCLQLGVSLGLSWWWTTHRKYYGSQCDPNNHNCGA